MMWTSFMERNFKTQFLKVESDQVEEGLRKEIEDLKYQFKRYTEASSEQVKEDIKQKYLGELS